jgi:DNA-binding transcriptional MerR regulator
MNQVCWRATNENFTGCRPGLGESAVEGFSDAELEALERAHPEGLGVQQIVDAFTRHGVRLTEATFRKYVQLGLLPRSTRVGRKGKHRGSQGLYPVTVVRQIEELRRLMQAGFTIEEIQRQYLFVRADIDALDRQIARVLDALTRACRERGFTSTAGESGTGETGAAGTGAGEGGAGGVGPARSERGAALSDELSEREIEEARRMGAGLVAKLTAVERRLSMRARMARAVV